MSTSNLVDELIEVLQPGVAPEQIALRQTNLLQARQGAESEVLAADIERLRSAAAEPARGLVARGIAAISAGALVEAGGPPRALGETLLAHLPDALEPAARFASACHAALPEEEPDEDTELLEVGDDLAPVDLVQTLADADPDGAIAWQALEYWALPTIACLTRDREVRDLARERPELRKLAFAATGYRGFLTIALDLLDDAPLIVLHPATHQGFEARFSAVASNFDLQVLLADALLGREQDGLPGARPDPAARLAIRNEGPPLPYQGHWDTYDARALETGSLPEEVPSERWIFNEGRPAEIPEVEGRRVVVLAAPSYTRSWQAGPMFSGLRPELKIERALSEAEVRDWLARLTRN